MRGEAVGEVASQPDARHSVWMYNFPISSPKTDGMPTHPVQRRGDISTQTPRPSRHRQRPGDSMCGVESGAFQMGRLGSDRAEPCRRRLDYLCSNHDAVTQGGEIEDMEGAVEERSTRPSR